MRYLLLSFVTVILLTGCKNLNEYTSIRQENLNPLTAIRYGSDLADSLADIIIQNDSILDQEGMEERIQKEISRTKATSRWGKEERARGKYGNFIPIEEDASGQALFLENRLYLSPTFYTNPGPYLHLYLTTVVDPRDIDFPDETALDLGEIQSAYGAQTYELVLKEEPEKYRTAVLWDTKLNRLYSFTQLSKR